MMESGEPDPARPGCIRDVRAGAAEALELAERFDV
jgi:hypothetical protein